MTALKKNLLLIDHDTETASSLCRLFHAEGYHVTHVQDSREVARSLASATTDIDLVLMDIDASMGIETAREIVDDHALPLLILTSRTDRKFLQEADEISSYGFVPKNSTDVVLLASVKTALRLHNAGKRSRSMDDELRETEVKFRTAFENTAIGMSMTDLNGRLVKVNKAFAEMVGRTLEEMHTIDFSALTHPDDQARSIACVRSLVNSETKVGRFVKRYVHTDGHLVWADLSVVLIRNGRGEPYLFITQIQDITERFHAESALKESEARFKEIFDKAPLGYHELDEHGRIVRVNSTEAAMLGYRNDEMIGRFGWEFIADEEHSREGTLQKLRGEQQPGQGFERDFIKKDGTVIRVLLDDALLRNAEGRIVGIRTALQDITDRKRLEQQLLQSQKLEGVGTLAGGIAHDFNNLLAMILGSAEMLCMHMPETPTLKKYVDNIITASERGRSISRQLLIFSRPDHAELKPISLSHTITELHELLGHFLPKSIAIVKKIDVENGLIMGDAGQIHQAILNLALNAGDAMTNHGILTIKEFSVPASYVKKKFGTNDSASYVGVSVSDTGIGMDARTLAKIFDPFFTTKERGKGTGLGLSIVHGIIKNHNGFIDVESTVGKGTTFTMFFPALPAQEARTTIPHDLPAEKHNEQILVVDDEDLIRDTLSEFLSFAGYTVYTASNGKDALKLFGEHHSDINLVVTDLGMPEMSGEELFRKLRDIDRNAKVVVSSGYLDGTTKSDLLSMGIKDVLTKPFKMQDIRNAIEKALN
ncbi:MAG TPA: PAS domain S-box protein [Bacteroidota bacterium]|nr:PAS domain S-box protein [Bacteroidota bacterium]